MKLPLPAGSYKHPSRPTNYQLCINYFPTSTGPGGVGGVTLLPTMGSQLLNNEVTGQVRFLENINNTIYLVIGNKFYSSVINTVPEVETMTLTELGTLNSDTGVVIGTNNPTQIILLDGNEGYIYNNTFAGTVPLGTIGGLTGDTYNLTINGVSIYSGLDVATVALHPDVLVSTINTHVATTHVTASYQNGSFTLTGDGTISKITVTESGTGFVAGVNGITVDPGVFSSALNFEQFQTIDDVDFVGGSHVVYIDGYFIVNVKNTHQFQFSQPNEGRVWNSLDFASAESKPDQVVAIGEAKGEAWLFGTNSVEVWYDAANQTGSPFSKRIGSDIDIGCLAPYSVINCNDVLIWLDSRGFVVQSDVSPLLRNQSSGYTLTKISDEAIDTELKTYPNLTDAIGMTYLDRGHIKYEITFPSAKKTWVYDFNTQAWHERGITNELGQLEYTLNQFCDEYNEHIISGGIRDNKIYIMKKDYYYDNQDFIHRAFSTSHIANEDFTNVGIDNLELKMKTGETGMQTQDANVILQFSDDNSYTLSNELPRSIGNQGDYKKRIIWNMLGSYPRWWFLFKFSAPIDHAIIAISAKLDVEAA